MSTTIDYRSYHPTNAISVSNVHGGSTICGVALGLTFFHCTQNLHTHYSTTFLLTETYF